MSGRIVTEKYINDLGGRYLSSASYHLELIIQNSDFILALGSDRVYCPTFAERSSIDSSYASVYTLIGGTFHLLSGLYVYVPDRVYSGQSGTLYSIASGDFVPEATITFNMFGSDYTCATKLDAINAGCSVSGLTSYTLNLLIPTASVTGPGKATVSYNGYYVDADEVVASTKYSPSYNTRGSFGAYETEFPYPEDQTEIECNQVYTHVIGTTCTITKALQSDEDILAVDILKVEIVSNSSGKPLASGSLPLSFTLTENCWVRIHAVPYTLTGQPPTFKYSEGSDELTLSDLNFGKVYLVPSSVSTYGQLLFQKSSGQSLLGAANVNNTLLNKYIYFYADSYLALATTPVLLDDAEKMYPLVLVNAKESSPGTPSTQIQLFASVHEYWFSFPEDLPLDRSYRVVWSLKDCRTILEVPEYKLEQVDRVLTIINNGVGPVTVNGVTYTQPITYPEETRVTIKWPEYKRVAYAEVDIMYRTDTYTVTDSISLSVRMSKTTVTLTPKPVICEYTTVTLTALSPGNTWETGVSIKSNLWNSSRSLYEIEGSTINVATSNTLSIFTNNKYVTSVSCFSSKNSGTYSVPNNCFNGCVGLKSALFDIPTYITYGQNTFYNCTALDTVSLTDNVKSFGVSCFESSGIKTFVCPPLITTIPTKMAHACLRLHTVNLIPATTLSTIEERAFSPLKIDDATSTNVVSSLTKVQIPASIQSIKNYAFAGNYLLDVIMTSPTSIIVSGTNKFIFNVDSSLKNKMSRINKGVFSYCTGLRHVLLPSSINTLETESFDSCDNIMYFNSPGLKVVMNDAFKNTWLEGMKSKNLELVHETTNGYYGGSLYRKPYTTGIFFDTTSANLGGLESKYTMCTYISPKTDDSVLILYKCNTAQKGGTGTGRYLYPINKDTISISPYAFSGNYDFGNIGCYSDVRMSESDVPADSKLEYIGYAAFYDNDRIMTFRFPKKSITSHLGSYAFCGCNNLSEIYNFKLLPITRIEDYTFWGCGTDKYGIGGSIDAGYNNCEFYIPDTVTSIGKYAFAKCPQLMCIANLSTCNITSIEEGAFEGCFLNATWKAAVGKAVTLFTVYTAASLACAIYGGLESLLRPAWLYSHLLGKWIITYVLEYSIEWGAVAGAGAAGAVGAGSGFASSDFKTWHERRTQTAEVCLPKVRLLGSNVFKDCTHLGAIILNKNLTEIPKLTFAGCARLHDVNFVEDSFNIKSTSQSGFVHPNIKTIGEEAFLNCKNLTENCIEHLLFNIETIKKNAFKGCKIERSIVIPKTVNVLEEGSLGFKGDCTCIFLSKTPPSSVSSNVFSGTGTKTIGVRQGCKSAYLAKFPKASIHELSDDNELFVEYQKYGYKL